MKWMLGETMCCVDQISALENLCLIQIMMVLACSPQNVDRLKEWESLCWAECS